MGVNVWNIITEQERELNSIEKLWRLGLIRRSANVAFFMTYFKVSNAVLKTLLKAHIRFKSLLRKVQK
jgi:hypothetical protein